MAQLKGGVVEQGFALDFLAVGKAGVEGEGGFVEVGDLGCGAAGGGLGIVFVQ